MRGRGHARAHLARIADHRNRERRALDRVGARAKLVEQHKVALPAAVHDGHDGLHVRGEGGKRLLDRLLVANVRIDVRKQADFGLLVCRDVQAGGRHQAEQTERFKRHGLAARVRSGDDQRVVVRADRNVDRHGLVLVEQRMPRAQQAAAARALGQHRRGGVHLKGQLGARKDKVERDQRVIVLRDRALVQRNFV